MESPLEKKSPLVGKAGLAETSTETFKSTPTEDNQTVASLRNPGPVSGDRQARNAIRAGVREAEAIGLSGSTILVILMSETLPRLTNAYGAADAALILNRIAHDICTGAAPNTARQ